MAAQDADWPKAYGRICWGAGLTYNIAMQRARDEMKPKALPPAQPASATGVFLVFVHLSTRVHGVTSYGGG